MNVAEKVDLYKKDLKKSDKKFNLWAFIFGSFYFFYTGVSVWYFFLFFVFPWIFTAALISVFPHVIILAATGFVISHIWAGFVANPEARRYKEEYIKRFKGIKLNANVKYFNISLLRLWLSSFFTMGLYDVYWSYRNWSAYKKATKDDVEPLLLALFNFITIFRLQNKIQRLLPERKKTNAICALLYSIVFISAVVLYVKSSAFAGLFMLTAYIILPMLLFPIQKSINALAEKTLKTYTNWETALLIVGVFWFFQSIFTTTPLENRLSRLSAEEQQTLGETVSFVYKYKQAYSQVCAAEGYQLKKYPNDFAKYFQAKTGNYEKFLRSNGLTIQEITEKVMSDALKTKILISVYNDLKELRKSVIINVDSVVNNIPPEKVVWREELAEAVPLAEICELFDLGGIDLLKNSDVKSFLKGKKF